MYDGRLVVVDVAILPEHRSAGIGTSLLEDIFETGDRAGLAVRFTVAHGNARAVALLERLGCERVGEDAFFWFYERAPRGNGV